MNKKTQVDVQTSVQPVDPAVQEAQKQKLIADGVQDPSHLEILTDQFAGEGGSYLIDESGKRSRID